MRRIVFVLADGLRPDAVTGTLMPSLHSLANAYTRANHAVTVRPSATVAALASLATGVGPETHSLIEPGLAFLPRLRMLRPVARELARGGVATAIVTSELAPAARAVARALSATAGARRMFGTGTRARATASAANRILRENQEGLVFVYLPDCDRAGHAHGWMSAPYLEAAAEVDAAVGVLASCTADMLLIVTADHGGGGVEPRDHDELHPLNSRIPLVLAGPGVARSHTLLAPVSILDLPATILWWLGCEVPPCYEGRPLIDAFERVSAPEPVPA